MPPFGDSLTAGQRWDVIAYLVTLSHSPQMLAEGEDLYQANCASCHGEKGAGDGMDAASLGTPPTAFTDQEAMASISEAELFQTVTDGVSPDMPAYGDQLSDEQRWALAGYVRSLTFAPAQRASAGETSATPEGTLVAQATGEAGPTGEAQTTGTPVAAVAQTGSVTGNVVNGSGGELPSGLTVTLHGFDNMQTALTLTADVQPDGSYAFQDVEMPDGRAFISSIDYNNTTYDSDVTVVEAGMKNIDQVIPIYETTTDTSVISADRLHIFFDFSNPDILRVVELYIISNLSNRTLVPPEEGKPALTFDLPAGATNLQFQDGTLGDRYIQTDQGFGDTAPVNPGQGQHQVVYAFDKGKFELTQPVNFPVDALVILVPESGIKVKGEHLADAGTSSFQGTAYHLYNGDRLEAGSQLALTVSGRPGSAGTLLALGSSSSLVIGVAAFGLALVVIGLFLYARNRSRYADEDVFFEDDGAFSETRTLAGDPEALMDAILALDDQYQSGQLPDAAYQQRRAELKEQLRQSLGETE
jgi:mono/diheme cytochrome c family protein